MGYNVFDTANGPGIRCSIFVAGCTVHCKDCFNKESWDFNAGTEYNLKVREYLNSAISNPLISGVSLLGGDPFEKENASTLAAMVRYFKETRKDLSVWAWSGRQLKDIQSYPLAELCDVIICGPYVDKYHVYGQYWGSDNQIAWEQNKHTKEWNQVNGIYTT